MDAKKCDRCGNYYIDKSESNFNVLATAFIQAIAPQLFKSKVQEKIEELIDLCPACSRDLTGWLKGKRHDETNSLIEDNEILRKEVNRLSYWNHMKRAAVIDELVTRIKNAHGTVNIDDIAREMKEPRNER